MQPASNEWATEMPPGGEHRANTRSVSSHTVTVIHHPSSAAVIRRELSAFLTQDASFATVGREFIENALTVATELVGNAIRHADPLEGGVIHVAWRGNADGLEIRVTDGGSVEVPVLRRVPQDAVSGRGLAIVAALSTHWGVTPSDQGRCVWAWVGPATQAAS